MSKFLSKRFLVPLVVLSLALPLGADSGSCRRTLADRSMLCLSTLGSLRSLQMCVEAYAADHRVYPAAATMAELQHLIEPVYIAHTPLTDAWGTEFRYVVSADGKSYRIVSAGSDRKFDEASWSASGLTSSSSDDAVLASDHTREWVIQQ